MAMEAVGLREFRANLHKYTNQGLDPIIVTSHGATIGYYIPARPSAQEQDLAALKEAVRKIAALLESSGVQEEDIIADFQQARRLKMRA
jgi:PHD/YefM family antitoxin component YafN of YafNO toxin-antitoxin module